MDLFSGGIMDSYFVQNALAMDVLHSNVYLMVDGLLVDYCNVLSVVLILTALIHCRRSIGEQAL